MKSFSWAPFGFMFLAMCGFSGFIHFMIYAPSIGLLLIFAIIIIIIIFFEVSSYLRRASFSTPAIVLFLINLITSATKPRIAMNNVNADPKSTEQDEVRTEKTSPPPTAPSKQQQQQQQTPHQRYRLRMQPKLKLTKQSPHQSAELDEKIKQQVSHLTNQKVLQEVGDKYYSSEQYEAAIVVYTLAVEKDAFCDEVVPILFNRSKCYSRIGKWKLAYEDAGYCCGIRPDSVEGFRLRAETAERLGEWQIALESYEECLKLDRNNEESIKREIVRLSKILARLQAVNVKIKAELESLAKELDEMTGGFDVTEDCPVAKKSRVFQIMYHGCLEMNYEKIEFAVERGADLYTPFPSLTRAKNVLHDKLHLGNLLPFSYFGFDLAAKTQGQTKKIDNSNPPSLCGIYCGFRCIVDQRFGVDNSLTKRCSKRILDNQIQFFNKFLDLILKTQPTRREFTLQTLRDLCLHEKGEYDGEELFIDLKNHAKDVEWLFASGDFEHDEFECLTSSDDEDAALDERKAYVRAKVEDTLTKCGGGAGERKSRLTQMLTEAVSEKDLMKMQVVVQLGARLDDHYVNDGTKLLAGKECFDSMIAFSLKQPGTKHPLIEHFLDIALDQSFSLNDAPPRSSHAFSVDQIPPIIRQLSFLQHKQLLLLFAKKLPALRQFFFAQNSSITDARFATAMIHSIMRTGHEAITAHNLKTPLRNRDEIKEGFWGSSLDDYLVEVIAAFLEAGADPNYRDSNLVMDAVWNLGSPKLVRLLIRHGADVNRVRINEFLSLDNEQQVSLPDVLTEKMTPLSAAAYRGHMNCFEILVREGGALFHTETVPTSFYRNPNYPKREGKKYAPVLRTAFGRNCKHSASDEKFAEFVKTLFDQAKKQNCAFLCYSSVDDSIHTPLTVLMMQSFCSVERLQILLTHNPNLAKLGCFITSSLPRYPFSYCSPMGLLST